MITELENVLGLVRQDPERPPTIEELTAAYWARMAEARSPRRRALITRAFNVCRKHLGKPRQAPADPGQGGPDAA
jgi:hypothetical protein